MTYQAQLTESKTRISEEWWAVQGSNLRPPVCKTGALPTELTALCNADERNCTEDSGKSQRKSADSVQFF